jgi:hypothetical protein
MVFPSGNKIEQVGIFPVIVFAEPFEGQCLDIVIGSRNDSDQLPGIRVPGQETLYQTPVRNLIGILVIVGHAYSVF